MKIRSGILLLTGLLTCSQAAQAQDTQALRDAVTLPNLRAHQQALQLIFDANGARSTYSAGYTESLDYVRDELMSAGYTVVTHEEELSTWLESSPSELDQTAPLAISYAHDVDFRAMIHSSSGEVTAAVQAVDLDLGDLEFNTSGCDAADFVGFIPGNIALMRRGACLFKDKAENAAAAGAAGALIMNQGNSPERLGTVFGTLLEDYSGGIPVLSTSYGLGLEFASTAGLVVHMLVDGSVQDVVVESLTADTAGGNPAQVILVGTGLDSLPGSPGINNHGSGVATVLEIAVQMAALGIAPNQRVRFGFWSGSNNGPSGLLNYLDSLSAEQLAAIEMYLDFQAVGSPNFARFIYDGDGSDGGAASGIAAAGIESVFSSYFVASGLASETTALNNVEWTVAADFGLPVGGLSGGQYEVKSPGQAALYGGVPGEQFDPCAGLPCDTFDNVSLTALGELADAAAHAVLSFAITTAPLREAEIMDLIGAVESLGLPMDIESGLEAKLQSALEAIARGNIGAARNKLQAFINQVEAKRNNPLTDAQADALIAAAQAILDELS